MTDLTTKRMSEERLERLRVQWRRAGGDTFVSETDMGDLLDHIDALRAELTAARTVADGEVAEAVERQSQLAAYFDGDNVAHIPQAAMVIRAKQAVNLLTRLSAAKAEAERERDEARTYGDELSKERAASIDFGVEEVRAWADRARAAEARLETAQAALQKIATSDGKWVCEPGDATKPNYIGSLRDVARVALAALQPQAPHPAKDET